jgi:hypothetical protein
MRTGFLLPLLIPGLLLAAGCETTNSYGTGPHYGGGGIDHPMYPAYPAYPLYPVYPYETHNEPDGRAVIQNRIRQTERSIERGVSQGALSAQEEQNLRQELNTIGQKTDRMKGDGYFSPREQDRIHTELNQLQHRIQKEKRDDERRRKKQR